MLLKLDAVGGVKSKIKGVYGCVCVPRNVNSQKYKPKRIHIRCTFVQSACTLLRYTFLYIYVCTCC